MKSRPPQPALLEAARAALGTDDVLVWSSDLNDKAALSPTQASAHQDSTYANLVPSDAALTAWLALSDAPEEAGCLVFARGSHALGQLEHATDARHGARVEHNLLAFNQTVTGYTAADGTAAPLRAGEASLHSFRTVHWSPPNRSPHRRVGLAIRYVAGTVVRDAARVRARESATLVCGEYEPLEGAFDLEPEPAVDAGEAERRAHEDAMRRERENYFEGVAGAYK